MVSISNTKDYNKKNETYTEITAVVVDYEYEGGFRYSDTGEENLKAIIVEYKVDGKTYRTRSNSYSNMPKLRGTEVRLKYNPNNPSDVIWIDDNGNIIFSIIGGIFILVGLIVFVDNIRKLIKK